MNRSSTTLPKTLRTLRDVDAALALSNLSAYHIAFDRWTDARLHARDALQAAREARQYVDLAWMLQHLAAIAALSPAPEHRTPASRNALAAMLRGYVDRYCTRVGASRAHIERHEDERALLALRETLPGDHLEELMASGTTISFDEAVEFALSV